MTPWRELTQRARALLRQSRDDAAHQEEVRFHLDMLTRRFEERGVPPGEARRRARLEFGSAAEIREAAREQRGVSLVDDALRDLRHAGRQLFGAPLFTTSVTLTLALAIGAATAVFTAADHVLLRASPFVDPQGLVMVWETDRGSGTVREPGSLPDLLDLQRQSRTFSGIEALMGVVGTLNAPGTQPLRLSGVMASGGLLPMLGTQPLRGRLFSPAEATPGGPRVALISNTLWRTQFAGAEDIVGRVVSLNDEAWEVIGVMPDDADFGLDQVHDRAAYHATYEPAGHVDVWLPLQASADALPRETHPLLMIGRLAPGSSPALAQDELTRLMADLERQYPSNARRGAFVESLDAVVLGPSRPLFGLLLAAAGLLVLVAVVNVANLLLVRSAARAREVAVRGALGATAARLTRQFSVEAGLLVACGAIAGLGLAWGSVRLLRSLGPADVPRLSETAVDLRSGAVAVILAGLVGAVFSVLPALTAFRHDPMAVLKGEGGATTLSRRGLRLRNMLVMAQLALCVALGICTGLVLRSFGAVLDVDAGFAAAGVVKAQYELPVSRYPRDFSRFPNFTEITQFTDRVLESARALPGVEAAAIAVSHPLDEGFTNSWSVVGREAEARDWPEISVRIVTPGYAETMGLGLHRGRMFNAGDAGSAPPVALINQTAATRFFANQDPIGQQISFWGMNRRIVGVVGDERNHGLTAAAPPATFVPLHQAPGSSGVLLVRSNRDPSAVAADLRRVVATVDPLLAVYGVEPFASTVRASVGQRRFAVLVMSAFAVATLVLVLIGVQGVVATAAAQRTRELGIRQALGASRGGSVWLVLRSTVGLVLAGVCLGMLGAVAASGLLAGLLFGITRHDMVSFAAAPLVVAFIAMGAALLPAWRAARRGPLVAMRTG